MSMQREVLGPQSILCLFFRHADRIFRISRRPGTPKSLKNHNATYVFSNISAFLPYTDNNAFLDKFLTPKSRKIDSETRPGAALGPQDGAKSAPRGAKMCSKSTKMIPSQPPKHPKAASGTPQAAPMSPQLRPGKPQADPGQAPGKPQTATDSPKQSQAPPGSLQIVLKQL